MMMMMGRETLHPINPTVQITPWDDPMDHMLSPFSGNSVFLDEQETVAYDFVGEYDDVPLDAFSCDDFRMYEFKVRRCARGRSHDWTDCPYAHPGEKARRRDPRKFHYSGSPCPELRKGTCQRGDTCEFAHGVFECWLHPSRYRTQPCKDGVQCRRRICFFAHTPDQLRVLTVSQNGNRSSQPDGSPGRFPVVVDSFIGKGSFGSSPTSTLYTSPFSPPMSPVSSIAQNSVNELTSYVRNLQIGYGSRLFCSPPSPSLSISTLRLGYTSLPATPGGGASVNAFDLWDQGQGCTNEEEPIMERVESGKDLRAKIYAKLCRDNSLPATAGDI